jgi:hypothetical protein
MRSATASPGPARTTALRARFCAGQSTKDSTDLASPCRPAPARSSQAAVRPR